MAARFFPDQDPVGRRFGFAADSGETQVGQIEWRTIVGVSSPIQQGERNEAFRSAVVYLPFREDTPRTASLLVRSSLPPATVMSDVRRAVQLIDADQPVLTIQTVADVLAEERLMHRIFAVSIAACLVPVRRASRVEPVLALRSE